MAHCVSLYDYEYDKGHEIDAPVVACIGISFLAKADEAMAWMRSPVYECQERKSIESNA